MQVVLEVENNGASVLVGQYGRFYNAFYYYFLDMNFPEIMMLILNTPVTEMIKNIMQDDVEEATLAKIFINKLTDVDPKIVSNIGMELNRLAFFVADQNLMDLLTPTDVTPALLNVISPLVIAGNLPSLENSSIKTKIGGSFYQSGNRIQPEYRCHPRTRHLSAGV